MTFRKLVKMFPNTRSSGAATGYIPMSFVEANKAALAAIVKQEGLRRIYRGPRPYKMSCNTRRGDAVAMVLYAGYGSV